MKRNKLTLEEKIGQMKKRHDPGQAVVRIRDRGMVWHRMALRDAGSIDQFISYLAYCAPDEEGKILELMEKWKTRKPDDTLDQIIERVGVDPAKVYGWAAEGAGRQTVHTARLQMAANVDKVVGASIEASQHRLSGFKDRHLYFKVAGLMPTSMGTRITVQQNNQNTAQARAESSGSELPKFETDRQAISQLVRAED